MPRNLADGQLAAASGTLLTNGTVERLVSLILVNTIAVEQTVVLTVTRSGSTARYILRAKLTQYQQLHLRGLPLDPSDVLAGYATSASAVDYIVSLASSSEPFNVLIRDADGSPKASADVTLTTTEKAGLTMDGVVLSGLLQEVRDALLKIA